MCPKRLGIGRSGQFAGSASHSGSSPRKRRSSICRSVPRRSSRNCCNSTEGRFISSSACVVTKFTNSCSSLALNRKASASGGRGWLRSGCFFAARSMPIREARASRARAAEFGGWRGKSSASRFVGTSVSDQLMSASFSRRLAREGRAANQPEAKSRISRTSAPAKRKTLRMSF